ncbi:sphingosine kinase 1 [Diospyros lotus]|uniref:sphingosine kinase 1 n=1 Tax=Diospyros lotus TaxID=55363 RepID=UPI0022525CB2|nr:sphingosine kinase 1 [Diospyros lotus]
MEQTDGGEPILSDRVRVNGSVSPATLTAGVGLQWMEGGSRRCMVEEKDFLGFSAEGPTIKIRTVAEDRDGSCCFNSRGHPATKTYVFEPLSEDSLRLWCRKLEEYFDSLGRPKRLLIFVNPYGGKKYAYKIFIDDVKPLLDDANIECTVQETKYQLHAKEVVQTMDISKYDGIVCVSGDGILVEVVNGLLEREDWNAAIKMPLGVVPAGTGNGMAKSLMDSVGLPCIASNAVLAIIQGHKRPLDVASILQGETRFFSVLMLAWGLVADIDIESEKYRWMGSARMDFYAIQRIFHLRKYSGWISFVPAPGFEACGEPSSPKDVLPSNINNPSQDEPMKVHQRGYQGPQVDLESLEWRKIDGPFVSVWLHNVPWGGEDTKAAPDAKFSDGYLDLILMKDCPRFALLSLMTKLSNGDHVKSPYVLYLKVKAFVLEPGPRTDDATKEGIIDVDGEVIARGKGTYKSEQKTLMDYEKLQIVVDQGLAVIYAPL